MLEHEAKIGAESRDQKPVRRRMRVEMGYNVEREGFLIPMDVGAELNLKNGNYKVLDYNATQKVITDKDRRILSNPYMDFQLHTDGDRYTFLVGRNGSMQYILKPPVIQKRSDLFDQPSGFFEEANETPFNGQIQYRKDLEHFVIWNRTKQYLIDPTGKIISDGYHKLYPVGIYGEKHTDNGYEFEKIRKYA